MRNEASPHKPTARTEFIADTGLIPRGCRMQEIVIIAAGFDAAEGDMLGGCQVTPAGYAHMTHMLCSLAGGRVVAALEVGKTFAFPFS